MAEENNSGLGNGFYFDALLVCLIMAVAALSALSFFNAQQQFYTLLYFSPKSLPATAKAGQALSFDFFIENHEGLAMQYSFVVSAEGEAKVKKTILLQDKEKKQLSETLVFGKASAKKQKVSVQLKKRGVEKPQEFFFWVAVSN